MPTVLFDLFMPQMRMPFDTILDKARTAEQVGFDGVSLMDHLTPPGLPESPMYDCFVTAAAIASVTQRITITPLVTCASFRHPALLAKMAVSLDHLSGGRFELGIGWGSVPDELNRFGIYDEPPAVRSARLAEQLDVLTQLFGGGVVDHEGRFYRLRRAQQRPIPLHGTIPILIGGGGPTLTLPLVARHADWWNCPSYDVHRIAELRHLIGRARVSSQHVVGLAASLSTLGEVRELARKRFANWGSLLVGTPDQIAAELIELARLGIERFFLPFSDFAPRETLELFAAEVIPQVRAAVDHHVA